MYYIINNNIVLRALALCVIVNCANAIACRQHESSTFVRWSGMTPDKARPVFMYSASGDEESLTGACLARCRDLEDCASVIVTFTKGNCQGLAASPVSQLRADNDAAYFTKVCLKLPTGCSKRWWALESTPGYYLNSEGSNVKVLLNATVQDCYDALFSSNEKLYRSAQWIDPHSPLDTFVVSDKARGNCILNGENKFTEPESYRVSNYYTFYIENECGHDYPKKIDRCSYEEYNNQTLKRTDLSIKNATKDECKTACENEDRFICRGFSFISTASRGLCDLHSEDLITTGSWLLRRVSSATYYRRVICLNITVDCEGPNLVVTYRPRGAFKGRMYVPGNGEKCGAQAFAGTVKLSLPLHGDCDVNFAYAITKTPNGVVNRTMAYVVLMIQNNPIIQTAGDRWVRVGCSPDGGARSYAKVDATVSVHDTSRPSLMSESSAEAGASAVFGAGAAPLSMYVVRTVTDGGTNAVSLGEPLELRIETSDDTEIEAYHLVASSRMGDSSVLLLDSRGCPTGQVDFPSFTRSYVGNTQRLSARFKAFRFPNSHVVRFAIMVRFCENKCAPVNCGIRSSRQTNSTFDQTDSAFAATVRQETAWNPNLVAQGGSSALCAGGAGRVPLELEMVVGARDILSADTLVRADHRSSLAEDTKVGDGAMVCVHELLLVALVLAWLAVQVLLLLGCCVLVKRYRNLAEMNMQKDYHSFDNIGFDNVSTHRRVHWPDQNIDILHAT
ncbi:uncharacterized protein LOC123693872 [Colias croceus]|uniref:uncharacterized protein LOC123693872 n=1 Tax=Colias crocea TaxID=72248 RepID=UPI001E280338|nr:uncharacterized protein LOC123693872 [Colias croceus]